MEATMSTTNPLADSAPTDPEDQILVLRARSCDRAALEELGYQAEPCKNIR
jgi:hypothetical protein